MRNNEPSAILDQRSAVSAFQERTSFDKPPATTDKPNRVLHVVPEPIMKYEPMPPHVDSTTISVLPAPPEPAERAENAISVYVEHPGQQQEPELAFGHWSSTLSEIRQRIESLASGTLQRLPRLDQVCVLKPVHVPYSYHSQLHHRDSQSIRFPCAGFVCASL